MKLTKMDLGLIISDDNAVNFENIEAFNIARGDRDKRKKYYEKLIKKIGNTQVAKKLLLPLSDKAAHLAIMKYLTQDEIVQVLTATEDMDVIASCIALSDVGNSFMVEVYPVVKHITCYRVVEAILHKLSHFTLDRNFKEHYDIALKIGGKNSASYTMAECLIKVMAANITDHFYLRLFQDDFNDLKNNESEEVRRLVYSFMLSNDEMKHEAIELIENDKNENLKDLLFDHLGLDCVKNIVNECETEGLLIKALNYLYTNAVSIDQLIVLTDGRARVSFCAERFISNTLMSEKRYIDVYNRYKFRDESQLRVIAAKAFFKHVQSLKLHNVKIEFKLISDINMFLSDKDYTVINAAIEACFKNKLSELMVGDITIKQLIINTVKQIDDWKVITTLIEFLPIADIFDKTIYDGESIYDKHYGKTSYANEYIIRKFDVKVKTLKSVKVRTAIFD